MFAWMKKALGVLLITFVLYYAFTQPEQSAQAVRTFFGGIVRLFRALAGG